MAPLDLTPEQTDRLRDNYAWHIVDGMDLKDLARFAAETIAENLATYDPDAIAAEILRVYDGETLAALISEARGE